MSYQISSKAQDIHPALWLWLPIATFIAQFTVPMFLNFQEWLIHWESEWGVIENMQVVFCLVAMVYAIRVSRIDVEFPKGIKWLMLLGAFTMFMLAGEEISWGQWYFHWDTPETWKAVNEQNETNLHNLSEVFSRYPRHVITLFCFIAGVIMPLVLRRRRRAGKPINEYISWLTPTMKLLPICLVVSFVTLPTRILDSNKMLEKQSYWDMAMPSSEFREYFIALFFMAYFISLFTRIMSSKKLS